jgi:hypothetical protein
MKRALTRHLLAITLTSVLLVACGSDSSGPAGLSGPPTLADINGATQPSGPPGGTVVLDGQNFGDVQGPATVLFSNGSGGTVPAVIASPADWSSTFVVTTVPAGAATGPVVVTTALGTSNAITFTLTQNAAFNPSTITWTATSALPVGLSGHAVAFAELHGATTTRAIYSVGGGDQNNPPGPPVYLATVGSSGTLSSWSTTAELPKALAFAAATVATPGNSRVTGPGFLYVIGGATDTGGQPSATVYCGTLSEDGTVSSWTETTALPVPLHSMGAVIFHGDLYVAGGSTTGNAPSAAVYRSRIDATGALGAWQTEPALPFARAHAGLGAFGGYLFTFGGDSGTVAPNAGTLSSSAIADVASAKIELRTGDLTSAGWTTNPNKLKKTVTKHTAVVAGGDVLVTAGLYNGASTGSTEETYAQFNNDGTVGSFNGATGSNTISSAGGGNLFNHAALGYTDGNGAFHVLVVGGDDVNNPGTKHTGVFFY